VDGTYILLLSSITKCQQLELFYFFLLCTQLVACLKNICILFPIYRSGDSSARIWTIADGPSSSSAQNGPTNVVVLKHFRGRTNEKSKDVTTLDWNVSVYCMIMVDALLYYSVLNQASFFNFTSYL
jgi:hypothetical protein